MAVEVNIKKALGSFKLDVSFSIEKTCLGILGASGCGKSMALKCIAGIERPDQGRIIVDGRVLFDSEKKINLPPQKRHIGYLFQNYALFPTMTVEENIGAGIVKKNNKAAAVREQIERFQLNGQEKLYPSQLSGGQQQRVALARMLASRPDMIMLDEPFSALDSHLKDAMQREMRKVIEQFEGTVLIVSHSRDELYRLCPQLAVMNSGSFLHMDSTKAVFDNPMFVQAARLTGCKNISAIRKISDYEVEALDWCIKLRTKERVGSEITHIGIRAHHFTPSEGQGAVNEIPVELTDISESPFEMHYFMKAKGMQPKFPIWWKLPKYSVNEPALKRIPPYLTIRPEDIMLLKGPDA